MAPADLMTEGEPPSGSATCDQPEDRLQRIARIWNVDPAFFSDPTNARLWDVEPDLERMKVFVESSAGRRLLASFVAIPDPKVRQLIVELVLKISCYPGPDQ